MNRNNLTMFERDASFANIKLSVDPIDRKRGENSDNVMAMFYEEQPFMWEHVKNDIAKTIKQSPGNIDFLDVGTGSGVWSILVAKNLGARNVIAIDKSARAIVKAKKNAKNNNVSVKFLHEYYNMNSAPYRDAKVIGIYAPYHLYPKEIEMKIPQHARGGVDGQQIFKEQLVTANYHLANGGSIVFNQMCLGKNGKPLFSKYIPQLLDDVSLSYINIFPAIKTADFLRGVYGNKYKKYQKQMSSKYPELFYCDGIITRDGKKTVKELKHSIDLKGRTWKDRIELHKQIALHGE